MEIRLATFVRTNLLCALAVSGISIFATTSLFPPPRYVYINVVEMHHHHVSLSLSLWLKGTQTYTLFYAVPIYVYSFFYGYQLPPVV